MRSAEELLVIARRYWPTDNSYALRHERSPETQRLHAQWKQEQRRVEAWRALLPELRRDLPGFSIRDNTSTLDAGFRCAAYAPAARGKPPLEWGVIGCMSLIAPVYTVYGVHLEYRDKKRVREQVFLGELPHEMREPAAVMARRLESTFGVSALPLEVAALPVPLLVEWKAPPVTTLFHALFTSEPENVF
jgi:hypothetical protein